MASGQVDNRSFVVIGRIRYEWEQGSWNEWHLLLNDQNSGWLSDAQLSTRSATGRPTIEIAAIGRIKRGQRFKFNDAEFGVTHLTGLAMSDSRVSCPSAPTAG
jgi:hypothetical protein